MVLDLWAFHLILGYTENAAIENSPLLSMLCSFNQEWWAQNPFFFQDWIILFPPQNRPKLLLFQARWRTIPKHVGVGGWYVNDNWLIRCLFLNQIRIMVSGKPSCVGKILALQSSFPCARSDGATRVSHSQKEDNTQPSLWERDAFSMQSSFASVADLIYKNSRCCIS